MIDDFIAREDGAARPSASVLSAKGWTGGGE